MGLAIIGVAVLSVIVSIIVVAVVMTIGHARWRRREGDAHTA